MLPKYSQHIFFVARQKCGVSSVQSGLLCAILEVTQQLTFDEYIPGSSCNTLLFQKYQTQFSIDSMTLNNITPSPW